MYTSICCQRCGKSTTSATEVIGYVDSEWKCVPNCDVVFFSRKLAFKEAVKHPKARIGKTLIDTSGPIRITVIISVEEESQ